MRGKEGLQFDDCILRNIQNLCLCTCPEMCIFIYGVCDFDALQTWTTMFISRNPIFALLIKSTRSVNLIFTFWVRDTKSLSLSVFPNTWGF